MPSTTLNRRAFLATSSSAIAASSFAHALQAEESSKRSVAVIGHTGRGNFGHGLDTVWLKFPKTQIVAVADGNEAGLAKELKKLKVQRGYTDYKKMLAEVQPEFVSICPRHADQHYSMSVAAIEAGVKGIYIEKPFCRTPAEADKLKQLCQKHGTKIAVAHRNRYHPTLQVIDQLISEGKLGRLLEIRGRGKGDRRGGGEDLWVLGTHVLNLMQYFGGDPVSCSAVMLQDGKAVTKADVKQGNEGLGLLAANEVHARYEMSKNIVGYFDSIANDGTNNTGFGLRIIGSKGTINILCDLDPVAYVIFQNPFHSFTAAKVWEPITSSGVGKPESNPDLIYQVQHHETAIADLIEAVDEDRPPICNLEEAAMTVEMVCAVFESHRQNGKAVKFPLVQRENALGLL